MKQVLSGAIIFILAAAACIGHITARTEMRATEEVCELIRANYFRARDADVQDFLRHCETDSIPFTYTRAKAITHINRKLSSIHSSHLLLYSPEENRRLWENEGTDTGLRARLIDSDVVVSGTLDDSPARRAGLKAGDVVVSVNGEPPASAEEISSTAGLYRVSRESKFFQAHLDLEDLKEDLSPTLSEAASEAANEAASEDPNRTGVLKIASFLPGYFENDDWLPIAKDLSQYRHLVIDLRGNAGGSFPAMLRALSPFWCARQTVGSLWRETAANGEPLANGEHINGIERVDEDDLAHQVDRTSKAAPEIDDDLSVDLQLAKITASSEVALKTFGTAHDCFKGNLVVLVDSKTSSVSEIFAHALSLRSRSEIWGEPSAGQVVVARWFSVGSLGGGDFALSIPIAGYRAVDGKEIESVGIHPKKELHYDLQTALRGEDLWLRDAIFYVSK